MTAKKGDDKSLDMADSRCQVFIVTVYNNAKDITAQIHTICITKKENGYIIHNAYRRNQKGGGLCGKHFVNHPTLSEWIPFY